jgi:CRP-like cAMP-binding protein
MDAVASLEKTYLFRGAAPDELAALGTASSRTCVGVGELAYDSGDAADALYVMEIGTIELRIKGGDQTLATYGSGQIFGELAFFGRPNSLRREAAAVPREYCELLRIGYDALEQVLQAEPALALRVYRHAAARLTRLLRDAAQQVKRPFF